MKTNRSDLHAASPARLEAGNQVQVAGEEA
jgi:hypothetical protein